LQNLFTSGNPPVVLHTYRRTELDCPVDGMDERMQDILEQGMILLREGLSFISGVGFLMAMWFSYIIFYEMFRHRSMLEYPYPDIHWVHLVLPIVGFLMFLIPGVILYVAD